MAKFRRLQSNTVLAALYMVRGQERRRAEYKARQQEVIHRTGAAFVDTETKAGTAVRVYLPRPKGNTSDTTADKAMEIRELESQRDVQIMQAIDEATAEIGADIKDNTVRTALQKAIALNCSDCRTWRYEALEVPGISRTEFYRRRRRYLEDVAIRLNLG